MEVQPEKFKESARRELQNIHSFHYLKNVLPEKNQKREASLETFPDPNAAQAYGGAIRSEALARLPELLVEFEKNASAHGSKILWARDGKEANEIILRLAKERGVSDVTKGKSMMTEEIHLNAFLSQNGVALWETDLGAFITQLLDLPPFHIVGPAVNVPVAQIRDLFLQKVDLKEPTLDPIELGAAARKFLRNQFHRTRFGITGVNIAVAETGTIINLENEGNIRLNKSSPQTQVSVMGLEKVVPTLRDALHLMRLLSRNCTAQKLSAYVTLDNGPKKKDEIDGPEELFILIVDNGRSKIYKDFQAREALRCIRCGACLNNCPIYRQIGGYPYGGTYSGPMAQVLTPALLGLDRTQDLYRASTLCGKCKSVCPAGIDHPGLFLYYRSKDVEGNPLLKGKKRPWREGFFVKGWIWTVNRSQRWVWGSRLLRFLMRVGAKQGMIRKGIGPLSRWCRSRDLPVVAQKTFRERWKEIAGKPTGWQADKLDR